MQHKKIIDLNKIVGKSFRYFGTENGQVVEPYDLTQQQEQSE